VRSSLELILVSSVKVPTFKRKISNVKGASVLSKRLAGKNITDMTYLVSSGTLHLNSISEPIRGHLANLYFTGKYL